MGSLYISQYAAANLSGISCRAYRVLLRMALVAMDEDTAPGADDEGLYYGGWKGLTACLGYGIYDREDELPDHIQRTISRAIKELRDAELLTVAPRKVQREHWNRVYRLALPPPGMWA
jgi:hypothetical protein